MQRPANSTPRPEQLDDVGEFAIPTRLPPGARILSSDFGYWSDVASDTVDSPLRWPKVGEPTVRALPASAEDGQRLRQRVPHFASSDTAG